MFANIRTALALPPGPTQEIRCKFSDPDKSSKGGQRQRDHILVAFRGPVMRYVTQKAVAPTPRHSVTDPILLRPLSYGHSCSSSRSLTSFSWSTLDNVRGLCTKSARLASRENQDIFFFFGTSVPALKDTYPHIQPIMVGTILGVTAAGA